VLFRSGAPARRGRKRGAAAQALGRSRGGFSTKLHLAVDRHGHPLGFVLTGGEKNEQPVLDALLRACRVANAVGRSKERPAAVVADRAYSSRIVRRYLRQRGIRCVVPRLSSAPPARAFDRAPYRERNKVERAVGRLKQFRRIATRFEKLAARYAAMATLALIRLWLGYR
jgi:transposase